MLAQFYQKMGLPDKCRVEKRVYKKLFYANADLKPADKKALQDDVETIYWKYALKPDTIQIQPYRDQEREYLEAAIIQVNLKQPKRYKRLAELIHRAIPYPLLLVFVFAQDKSDLDAVDNKHSVYLALSLATKRFSRSEYEAVLADEFFTTDWINMENPSEVEQHFLESLQISALPWTDFFAFYQSLTEKIIALECARLTGRYSPENDRRKQQIRKQRLAESLELEKKIQELRKIIQKESRFNRKVELNARIKDLEKRLNNITEEI